MKTKTDQDASFNARYTRKMNDATLSNAMESITCDTFLTDFHKRNDIQILIEDLYLQSDEIRRSEIAISKISKRVSTIAYHSLENNKTNSFNVENGLELIDSEDKFLKSNTLLKKIPEFHSDLNPLPSTYRKNYDERQLPLVGVDYKCYHSKSHQIQFSGNYEDFKAKVIGNNSKFTFAKKSLKQTKKGISNISYKRIRELDELQQYQRLINTDKERILRKSKYSKMSVWAEHLKEPIQNKCWKNPFDFTNLSLSVCNLGTTSAIDVLRIEKYLKCTEDFEEKVNKQRKCESPITDVIRSSLQKIGIEISAEKRRVSRQMLTDMNIAQLQILVNDLHNQIEYFNDILVHYLTERDELHMEQDPMIVDIEDLIRYLGDKHSLK